MIEARSSKISYLSRRGIEYISLHIPIIRTIYWEVAPKYYQWYLKPDLCDFALPISPFSILYTSPKSIDRFTGIQGNAFERVEDIGKVQQGNWDKKNRIDQEGVSEVFTANRLTDTILYKSLKSHFEENINWEHTQFIKELGRRVSRGEVVWHGCQTEEDIYNRCEQIDYLFENIRLEGYKTQFDIVQNRKFQSFKNSGFINMLLNEITVDIGRDGSLLFVDGRHRLSISKILNLEKVPVFVITRHNKWLDKLKQHQKGKIKLNHPDVNTDNKNSYL